MMKDQACQLGSSPSRTKTLRKKIVPLEDVRKQKMGIGRIFNRSTGAAV